MARYRYYVARLSVIGTGYLGVTHAACMASLGHQVIALDTDQAKLDSLASGHVPFHEPGLGELLTQAIDSGRLTFTSSWQEVAEQADIHFVCVGTPQQQGSEAADLSQVNGAVASLAEHLSRPAVVVGKSTVPVGTAARLSEYLAANSPAGSDVHLVWNPEFLREGFAVEDTLTPDRIVLGVTHQEDVATLSDVYAAALSTDTPLVVTDYQTAELVKVAANAFLATKISFINAFADLCDAAGADITTLADAIGHDTRIGRRFLNAGIGFGGGCLPKDIRALHARADELGVGEQFNFLHEVDAVNTSRRQRVIELAVDHFNGNISGHTVTVLGAAFKPDSDDIRDSPALDIAQALSALGAQVRVHDPVALPVVAKRNLNLELVDDVNDAVRGAELILHLTEWKEYRALDPQTLGGLVAQKAIIDGRNVLDRSRWTAAGWKITFLGKPGSN